MGIRKGEYCILNKQYSKEGYADLIVRIRAQMQEMPYQDRLGRKYSYGEFFPSELSPWAYNEATAYEWFPLEEKQATEAGFNWCQPDMREYTDATLQPPDHIKDVDDSILQDVLKCDRCSKNYLIIRQELDFYKRFQIPIPLQCPLCRDRERIARLNPMDIYERNCASCGKGIQTSYAPDRPEIVYCEACYQAEVV